MSIVERLDEYAALAEAATPGPWQVGWGEDDDRSWVAFVHDLVEPNDLVVTASGEVGSLQYCEPDAAFISASRSAVPALVEALRAVLALTVEWDRDPGEVAPVALLADDVESAIATALGVES